MKHDRCITIDLHGMTVSEARKRIQQLLKNQKLSWMFTNCSC